MSTEPKYAVQGPFHTNANYSREQFTQRSHIVVWPEYSHSRECECSR